MLKVFIPFYQRLHIYNCYEYLEYRFDVGVRTTASLIFILWRFCWMGFTLYLPAYALNQVMGLPLLETVIGLGIITTAYTTMGGVRAVVWTDVIQALIMFAGILVAIALLLHEIPGGLGGVWSAARDADLVYFSARIPGWDDGEGFWHKVSLYFHHPITFFAVVIATFVGQLNNYGSDQVMIQRYLAARSLGEPLPGYTLEDCDRILMNDVGHVVRWKGNSDVTPLVGQPVRLKITMRNSKLYAFQFLGSDAASE